MPTTLFSNRTSYIVKFEHVWSRVLVQWCPIMNNFEHVRRCPCTVRSILNKFEHVLGGPVQWGQGVGALYKGGLGPGPVQGVGGRGAGPCMVGTLCGQTDTHARLKILPSPFRQWAVNVEFTLFWTIIFIPESGKLNCKANDYMGGLGCFNQMWE